MERAILGAKLGILLADEVIEFTGRQFSSILLSSTSAMFFDVFGAWNSLNHHSFPLRIRTGTRTGTVCRCAWAGVESNFIISMC